MWWLREETFAGDVGEKTMTKWRLGQFSVRARGNGELRAEKDVRSWLSAGESILKTLPLSKHLLQDHLFSV